MESSQTISVRNNGRRKFEGLDLGGRTIKNVIESRAVITWTRFNWLRIRFSKNSS